MKSGWEIVIRRSSVAKCRRIRISAFSFYLAVAAVIFLGIGAGYMITGYQNGANLQASQDELERQLDIKGQQIEYFAHRMDQIRGELVSIRHLSEEVEQQLGRGEIIDEGGLGGPLKKAYDRDVRRLVYLNSESELLDQMWTEIGELEEETHMEKACALSLRRFLKSRSALISSIPSLRPINGGFLSSPFGRRTDPFNGSLKMHTGIDFAHSNRVPVMATAEGVITEARYNNSYGNVITIYHGFGISTRYAHLSSFEIKQGDWVEKGEMIGRVGNTGRSTHRHLHYEVRLEGRPINPYYFLPEEPKG